MSVVSDTKINVQGIKMRLDSHYTTFLALSLKIAVLTSDGLLPLPPAPMMHICCDTVILLQNLDKLL